MPKINVEHESSLGLADATVKIRDFFEKDADLKKIDPKIEFDWDEKTKKANVKGSQFKATVALSDKTNGTLISVVVDLPLLLTPFRGKVEETLHKKLKKYLA